MTDVFDVLSDATRRQILEILLTHEIDAADVSVSEIVAATGLPQPTVSKQLKVLRDARLVTVRENGQHRLYRLDAQALESAHEWLAQFRGTESAAPKFLRWAGRAAGEALANLAGKAPWR